MSSDIIDLISSAGSDAVDQIIEDSGRLHTVVNGTGTQSATTEDGSLIPSVRKALLDNIYFKTPVLPWAPGTSVTVFNQLYSFTKPDGSIDWWFAPGATTGAPVTMQNSPMNDTRFRLFLNGSNISDIYAPINSPNFTGNPRAPTAAAGDSSTSVANTQFVHNEIEALKEDIGGAATGEFDNITSSGSTTTATLHVTSTSKFDGAIDASATTMSLNKLRMVGADAEIYFDESGTPPTGITTKSDIKPFGMTTGEFESDKVTTDSLTVTSVGNTTDVSTDLDGLTEAQYVHITGAPGEDPIRPQLIVDGIAKFGSIIADNIDANVDGKDIHPNSVVTDSQIEVGTNLSVNGNTDLANTTTVDDLIITGTVTGLTLSVDGQDINPRSVSTTDGVSVGTNLTVSGQTSLGSTSAQSLQVTATSTLGVTNVTEFSAESASFSGATVAQKLTASRIELNAETVSGTALTPSYTFSGMSSVVNLVIDKDITIENIDLSTLGAFTMNVYLRQDTVGGHVVTLGSNYKVLNPDFTQSTAPGSVTIMQLIYSGFTGDPVDVVFSLRS